MIPGRPRKLLSRQRGIDYAAVVARVNAGERPKDIAAELGVSVVAIYRGAHRYGWAGKPKSIDYARVVERLRAGERVVAIAKEYGVSRVSVYQGARRKGWTYTENSNHPRRAKVAALFARHGEAARDD